MNRDKCTSNEMYLIHESIHDQIKIVKYLFIPIPIFRGELKIVILKPVTLQFLDIMQVFVIKITISS